MIQELKKQLQENPDNIRQLLEEFGFEHINIRGNYIRFARNHEGGQNISICLDDEYINVMDFVHGERTDIISYIIKEKHTDFKTVLGAIKRILNLSDEWRPKSRTSIFGGCYDGIIHKTNREARTYDDSILDQYLKVGNDLWLKDGISLETQRLYDVCFDIENNGIVFPWRNDRGEIIAIKSRYNGEVPEGMSKYYYPVGGNISSSLYGLSENYIYLQNTEIFIGESEKQVLQLVTKGYRNSVSLGSNSLSEQQAKLILSLNPTKIIWLLDEGLPKENTLKNAQTINNYCVMRKIDQYWWNWGNSLSVDKGSKMSPGDCSKDIFQYILKYEIEKLDIKDDSCLEDDDL